MAVRFLVPPEHWQGQDIVLPEDELYHARRVLRLKEGDLVTVFDGQGQEVEAKIHILRRRQGLLKIQSNSGRSNVPTLPITLGQALPKGRKLDELSEDLTELGLSTLIPLETQHCVVRLKDKRAEERTQRWQRLADSAAKQCARSDVTKVLPPSSLSSFLEAFQGRENALGLMCWVKSEQSQLLSAIQVDTPPEEVWLLIGPEGGLSDKEVKAAEQAGFKCVSLGPRILRTETAGPAMLALVQYRWGDMGVN